MLLWVDPFIFQGLVRINRSIFLSLLSPRLLLFFFYFTLPKKDFVLYLELSNITGRIFSLQSLLWQRWFTAKSSSSESTLAGNELNADSSPCSVPTWVTWGDDRLPWTLKKPTSQKVSGVFFYTGPVRRAENGKSAPHTVLRALLKQTNKPQSSKNQLQM